MKLKIFAVGAIALALTACFGGSDDSPPPRIDVITVSGVMVTLDGTWAMPCIDDGPSKDFLVTATISGTSGIMTEYVYESYDGTCTGPETITAVYDVTFRKGSVMSITGWLDFAGVAADPPEAQDGSGPLLDNETVTSLTLTINSVTPADPDLPPGTEVPSFNVVDDTVPASPVMYGMSDYDDQKASNVPMTLQ